MYILYGLFYSKMLSLYIFFEAEFVLLYAYFFICSKCYVIVYKLPLIYSHTSHLNTFRQELYASAFPYHWTFS